MPVIYNIYPFRVAVKQEPEFLISSASTGLRFAL